MVERHTRGSKKPIPQGLRVQVPSIAPRVSIMNEDNDKKPITKCWTCSKELFDISEFVVIRWTPRFIGSYCLACNPEDDGDYDD